MKNWSVLGAVAALLACQAVQAGEEGERWSVSLEPYALITSIDGDASVGRVTGTDVEVDFGTILETLDFAAMVHVEVFRDDRWGAVLDYGFMNLSADISTARGGVVDAKVHQGVLEAFLVRRFRRGPNSFDVYAGVRWWDNDIDVGVDPAVLPGTLESEVKEDWVDPVIGARWHHELSDRWQLSLRGDVGGFSVASEFSAAIGVSAFYRFQSKLALELAYRATWVDYDDGTRQMPGYFAYDTVTHGPLIGLVVNF